MGRLEDHKGFELWSMAPPVLGARTATATK